MPASDLPEPRDPDPGSSSGPPEPNPDPSPLGSQPTDSDIDASFASIIAHWEHDLPADFSQPRPTGPGIGPRARPDDDHDPSLAEGLDSVHFGDVEVTPPLDIVEDPSMFGWRSYAPPEADDHFEPGPPQLPPVHDATYWLSVVGLTLGPLIVIWAAVFSTNPDPGWWVLFGITLTVAGFGLMVLRGSGDRDPDDTGAQV